MTDIAEALERIAADCEKLENQSLPVTWELLRLMALGVAHDLRPSAVGEAPAVLDPSHFVPSPTTSSTPVLWLRDELFNAACWFIRNKAVDTYKRWDSKVFSREEVAAMVEKEMDNPPSSTTLGPGAVAWDRSAAEATPPSPISSTPAAPAQEGALLPCPFCDGRAVLDGRHELWVPRCETDGCIGSCGGVAYETREGAIRAWNRRRDAVANMEAMTNADPILAAPATVESPQSAAEGREGK